MLIISSHTADQKESPLMVVFLGGEDEDLVPNSPLSIAAHGDPTLADA